ncbi:MAG: HD domain-containing protein [Patescibacteria group bacterium]
MKRKRAATNGKQAEMLESELVRKHAKLVAGIRQDHREKRKEGGGHHDLFHAIRVARTALCIAPDEETARLAWLAGILHNTDRLFGKKQTEKKLRAHLKDVRLDEAEKEKIINAVLEHDTPNNSKDGLVTIILKDADRIADAGAMQLMRGTQWFSGLPICLLGEPGKYSGAKFPNAKVVTDVIYWFLEWESHPKFRLRLPKAKKLAKPGFDFLRSALKDIRRQQEAIGMYPVPRAVKKIIGDYTN